MADVTEMLFALRTQVGARNHVLDIAEHFELNTVSCAFHTVQPSSLLCVLSKSY